jgi:predicted nucleic acid-binding protein
VKYLTDSTFVIDALTRQPYAHRVLPDLLREGLGLSAVSHMKLWDGVYGSRDPRIAGRELRRLLRRVSVLPFSYRVSLQTAALRRTMRAQGLRLEHRMLDILIAGTALTYDLILVTSDADFDDIPGLRRIDPRRL